MLRISDLTYRIGSRVLFDKASASLSADARIGFIGRNGTGKSTLLSLVTGRLEREGGRIEVPKRWRIGGVAQDAPSGAVSRAESVDPAAPGPAARLAGLETNPVGDRQAESEMRLADIGAHAAPARAAKISAGLACGSATQNAPVGDLSGGWRMRV